MFSVEIRINGEMISHIYGHNIKHLKGDWFMYDYQFYSMDNDKKKFKQGTVKHRRNKDSINILIGKILSDVKKDEKNSL